MPSPMLNTYQEDNIKRIKRLFYTISLGMCCRFLSLSIKQPGGNGQIWFNSCPKINIKGIKDCFIKKCPHSSIVWFQFPISSGKHVMAHIQVEDKQCVSSSQESLKFMHFYPYMTPNLYFFPEASIKRKPLLNTLNTLNILNKNEDTNTFLDFLYLNAIHAAIQTYWPHWGK